jgi:hypothetical protein
LNKQTYIGQYGYDPTQQMQDMDTLESTNKYGLSYEGIEDSDDTARNLFSVSTQGLRSGNVQQGGGEQKQASLGEGIISAGTGGTIDTRQQGSSPAFMQFGSMGRGGGGANYEHIAKTGVSTGASIMDWIQTSKADDVEEFQKQLDEHIQRQYDADQARQKKFDDNIGKQQQTIGERKQAESRSWDQELLRMNDLASLASSLREQAVA